MMTGKRNISRQSIVILLLTGFLAALSLKAFPQETEPSSPVPPAVEKTADQPEAESSLIPAPTWGRWVILLLLALAAYRVASVAVFPIGGMVGLILHFAAKLDWMPSLYFGILIVVLLPCLILLARPLFLLSSALFAGIPALLISHFLCHCFWTHATFDAGIVALLLPLALRSSGSDNDNGGNNSNDWLQADIPRTTGRSEMRR